MQLFASEKRNTDILGGVEEKLIEQNLN